MYNTTKPGGTWTDIQTHLPMLREFARGNVFEIGTRGGVSTAALLMGVKDHGGHVWSLDINDCAGLYAGDPNWTFLRGHSVEDSAKILGQLPRPLQVLFIDSEHSYQITSHELHIYGPLVAPGDGVILCHDTDLAGAGVRQALVEYGGEIGRMPTFASGDNGLGVLAP